MARIKVGVTAHRRHKHILKLAKGYRGAKHLLFRKANETVMKALMYARRDRRAKKREFRRLWIARITSSVVCGLPVSTRLPVLTACPTAVLSAD